LEGDHIKINHWLLPLSWLYGLGVGIRNLMFDEGVLKSKSFDLPVICVGNITVGGTGKTPHTEYLIRLLSKTHQVAVLSRGYKRQSTGYVLATDNTPMTEIGDEPYQMKHKFPKIHMAVDRDRCHGIEQLMKPDVKPSAEVIILDDAYQHRYVKAGLNILLMDYHRLIYLDKLLPAGRLRESPSGMTRADIVIVTKCPTYITPMDRRGIEHSLNLQNWQKLFFTTYTYPDKLKSVGKRPLLVTGIASPRQIEYDLRKILPDLELMSFPDHHNFTDKDIKAIRQRAQGRTILTTEKDATRLHGLNNMKVIPIQVTFLNDQGTEFDRIIQDFVQSKQQQLCQQKYPH
jgi:tetraacyldisaccharide 4'-kinase